MFFIYNHRLLSCLLMGVCSGLAYAADAPTGAIAPPEIPAKITDPSLVTFNQSVTNFVGTSKTISTSAQTSVAGVLVSIPSKADQTLLSGGLAVLLKSVDPLHTKFSKPVVKSDLESHGKDIGQDLRQLGNFTNAMRVIEKLAANLALAFKNKDAD